MKKILIISIVALGFASCEKKSCYECITTIHYTTTSDVKWNEEFTKANCNVTEAEIKIIEDKGTFNIVQYKGLDTIYKNQSTKCIY